MKYKIVSSPNRTLSFTHLFGTITSAMDPIISQIALEDRHPHEKYAVVHDTLFETPEYQALQTEVDRLKGELKHLNATSPNLDSVPHFHIEGAGLAGMFLASALEQKGITNYDVYEQRSETDFSARPNNVQARNDYRNNKTEAFNLMEALTDFLPERVVDYIQEVSLVFGTNPRPPKNERQNKLVFSVGNLQKECLNSLKKENFHFNSELDRRMALESSGIVINARGAKDNADPDPRILRSGNVIDSAHTWRVELPDSPYGAWSSCKPFEDIEGSFLVSTQMSWSWPIDSADTQEKHDYSFSLNLLKRAIKDLEKKEGSDTTLIHELKTEKQRIESGEKTHLKYRLAHLFFGSSEFSDTLNESPEVLGYPLTTTPNLVIQDPESNVFDIGDALSRPHPNAAHGMLGVFKSVRATVELACRLSHATTPTEKASCKDLYTLELFKTGLYQVTTLKTLQAQWQKKQSPQAPTKV